MFLDKEKWKTPVSKPGPELTSNKFETRSGYPSGKKQESVGGGNYFFWLVVAIVTLIALFIIYYFFYKLPAGIVIPPDTSTSTPRASTTLPSYLLPDSGNIGLIFGTSSIDIRAEDISFGNFYEKPKNDFKSTLKSYTLPIDIKVDAVNYYDIARKINLDPYIDQINKNGFAVIDNQFTKEADDFFDMYRLLLKKDIPIVVTNDFLFYYNQNNIKQVFKEIEKSVFYENVRHINQELYNIAYARYKKISDKTGLINDPSLEGARLETAYIAVALKLLAPTDKQINRQANFTDDTKFSESEAAKYDFGIPQFLKDDVEKEVNLIREAKAETKSPVLLYKRDYKYFVVPANYSGNAKLNNFYLALKWLNSVFPLYYQSNNCPNCLLDQDDWTVNLAAASFLTEDLYSDQLLKNQWAIIYKFISFFSGLRQDLTYLHYHNALADIFGDNFVLEDIFPSANKNRDEDLQKIQNKLGDLKFSAIEGNIPRTQEENKPYVGMRLLQEFYWPNDYIYKQLTGEGLTLSPELLNFDGRKELITYCNTKKSEYRCRGISLDILNLFYPIKNNDYFSLNTRYNGYEENVNEIKSELKDFNTWKWNNNIFWSTLDMSKNLLSDNSDQPVYTRNDSFRQEKDFNTFLGAWVNIHLPEDQLTNFVEPRNDTGFISLNECNPYHYSETNLNLVEEFIARNNMLLSMIGALKVTEKTNIVSAQIISLNKELVKISDIIKNELANQELDEENCKFLINFVKNYQVQEQGNKNFIINFSEKEIIKESINGVKLLLVVHNKADKKIIAVGPIFNYSENR